MYIYIYIYIYIYHLLQLIILINKILQHMTLFPNDYYENGLN